MRKIYYNRKSIRLKNYDYSQHGRYFVTICTKKRECILSQIKPKRVGAGLVSAHVVLTPMGKFVNNEIKQLEKRFPVKIEKCVIMPDHIHFIININILKWNGNEKYDIQRNEKYDIKRNEKYDIQRADTRPAPTIGQIICAFKSITSNRYIKYNKQIGEYKKLWQRGYYEKIIRTEKEYYNVCEYIKNNPIRYIQKLY